MKQLKISMLDFMPSSGVVVDRIPFSAPSAAVCTTKGGVLGNMLFHFRVR